jgi:hypothetical protein
MELCRPQTEQIVQRLVRDPDGASASVSVGGRRLLRPFRTTAAAAGRCGRRGRERFKAVIRRVEGLFVKNNHTFIDQYQGRDEIEAEINAHEIQKQGVNSIWVQRASGVCSPPLDIAGRDAA